MHVLTASDSRPHLASNGNLKNHLALISSWIPSKALTLISIFASTSCVGGVLRYGGARYREPFARVVVVCDEHRELLQCVYWLLQFVVASAKVLDHGPPSPPEVRFGTAGRDLRDVHCGSAKAHQPAGLESAVRRALSCNAHIYQGAYSSSLRVY